MLCLLHGYLLDGSGSNLWTRAVARAMCAAGRDIHLVCQEPHPDQFDFVSAYRRYHADGAVDAVFDRETGLPGRCILHKPVLGDTLPVYVPDSYEEFARVVPMVELPDSEIQAYLDLNTETLVRIVEQEGITAIHANHTVLMPVVAERVKARTGVPFAVMPHGSAIEYAVKRDPRFHAFAASALDQAGLIVTVGDEMQARVTATFAAQPHLPEKFETLKLGVDTTLFEPIDHAARPGSIDRLATSLAGADRGRAPEAARRLAAAVAEAADDPNDDLLVAAMDTARGYVEKYPDADVEAKLAGIDWATDDVLIFIGRLIANKGLESVIAALPLILNARPDAKLVVVGHGPMRESGEALLYALGQGDEKLVRRLAKLGRALEGGVGPWDRLLGWLDWLGGPMPDDLNPARYFQMARETLTPDRVVFTGYLTHAQLRHLLPCADVAMFPSIVPEAGPLVFFEALASGVFPLGTNFAGMAANIDDAAAHLPPADAELMRLRPEAGHTVADIAANTLGALALGGRHRQSLRAHVEASHDWRAIALRLAGLLEAMPDANRTPHEPATA